LVGWAEVVWAPAGQELRPADADGEVEEMEWRGEELATGPPPIQETIWGWVLEWELQPAWVLG
jgi:hypothetical protein